LAEHELVVNRLVHDLLEDKRGGDGRDARIDVHLGLGLADLDGQRLALLRLGHLPHLDHALGRARHQEVAHLCKEKMRRMNTKLVAGEEWERGGGRTPGFLALHGVFHQRQVGDGQAAHPEFVTDELVRELALHHVPDLKDTLLAPERHQLGLMPKNRRD
jgi:hypothetical protein